MILALKCLNSAVRAGLNLEARVSPHLNTHLQVFNGWVFSKEDFYGLGVLRQACTDTWTRTGLYIRGI
jgi:hypothetical protein